MSKENKSTKNNFGLAIALGSGLGLIFGEIVFNDVGIGLVIGAGVGIVLGGADTVTANNKSKSDE